MTMVGFIRPEDEDRLCKCGYEGFRHCPQCGAGFDSPDCVEYDPKGLYFVDGVMYTYDEYQAKFGGDDE
jgi:hypothetical protein